MRLARRLSLRDAVVLGLGAMLGAGVFSAFGPAAAAAGDALLLALLLAGLVAWANADSSARLAAVHPTSGGAYAYARARLSPTAGLLAGAAFLVGKTASAAAIALTVGAYVAPEHARPVAVVVVLALTALAASGVERSARVTAVLVAVVLATLAVVVVAALAAPAVALASSAATTTAGVAGVLEGAGLLFFAFAGYARIATLGEEVTDPRRTLPRAIAVALALVVVVYAAVGVALVRVLGADGLAASARPVAEAADRLGLPGGVAVVVAVATLAALASGLGVLLGLSRTAFAMARDGALPRALARLRRPAASPDRPHPLAAQLAVGVGAAVVAAVADLATALTISSVAVLVYYGTAHAAALTLPGRARRVVPVLGLVGCAVVAAALAL